MRLLFECFEVSVEVGELLWCCGIEQSGGHGGVFGGLAILDEMALDAGGLGVADVEDGAGGGFVNRYADVHCAIFQGNLFSTVGF